MHANITKADYLALENLRIEKDRIIVITDKVVALDVMDKTEYITKCEALLCEQLILPAPFQRHISNYPQRTHLNSARLQE